MPPRKPRRKKGDVVSDGKNEFVIADVEGKSKPHDKQSASYQIESVDDRGMTIKGERPTSQPLEDMQQRVPEIQPRTPSSNRGRPEEIKAVQMREIEKQCPHCGSWKTKLSFTSGRFRYRKCKACLKPYKVRQS